MAQPKSIEFAETETTAGMSFGMDEDRIIAALLKEFSADPGVDRAEFARLQGRRTFGGRRDIMEVLGYSEAPGFDEFWARYRRQGLGRRVINLPVEQTWGGGPLQVKGFPAWEAFEKRLGVQARLTELDRLASIGRYAVLLIGVREDGLEGSIDDTTVREILKQPVTSLSSLDDIVFLQQYSEGAAKIHDVVNSPADPRFGKPESYDIELASLGSVAAKTATNRKLRVHHSRVLHVSPSRTTNDTIGESRMMVVLDQLHDMDKVAGGSAEMFWQGADRSLVFNKNTTGGTGAANTGANTGRTDLKNQIEKFVHGMRRYISLTNSEVSTLTPNNPTPKEIFDVLVEIIAAGSDIPVRILIGSERGELASTQDRSNFADFIANRRTVFAQPYVLVPFFERLFEWKIGPDPSGLEYVWPPIEALGALEKADVQLKQSQAMKTAEEGAVLGQVFSPEEYRAVVELDGEAPDANITGEGISVDENDPQVQEQFERGRRAA